MKRKGDLRMNQREGVSLSTKIAYGGGDAAANIVFGMISTILTLFYTDYAGIPAATVGIVMLLTRIFDGFSDILMGFIIEKTHSKYGKCRPWILWMCVPYGISAVLLFTVPHTTHFLQALYMFVTYNFCTTICYTATNVPYSALSSMISREQRDRDMLSIFRMGLAPFGRIMGVSFTLPLVKLLGDNQSAWVKTMAIWAVMAVLLNLYCFKKCEENVDIPARKDIKVPFVTSLKAIFTNQYFYAGIFFQMLQNIIFAITGTMLPYYCKYVFHNDSWLYSTMYLVETALMIVITMFFSPRLLRRFGKKKMSLAGVVIALAGHLIYLIDPYNINLVFASCIIRGIGFAPLNSVFYGFVGEAVEFGQWKSHVRQEGLVFAGSNMGTKFGAGVTAALMTGLLGAAGYISSTGAAVVQPQSAVNMIINIYKIGPVIVWAAYIILLALYQLEKKYPAIMAELAEREARGEL